MASPSLQVWIVAELALKSLSDASTKTVYLSNRAALDDTNFGRYQPIIQRVSGIGVKAGETLPQSGRGQIVLDNSPNTYGLQRRFGDILERYTAIDQVVTIKIATTALSDLDITGDLSTVWVARIVGARQTYGANPTIILDIAQDTIARRVITKPINTIDFSAAPTASLGKHLPIVIGSSVEVDAIQIDATTTPKYAYCTTLGSTHISGGVQAYYVRDYDGIYRQVTSAGTTSTAVYTIADSGATNADEYWLDTIDETAVKFAVGSKYIGVTVRVKFQGTGVVGWVGGTATQAGKIIFRIYEENESLSVPGQLIGTAVANKADYQASFRGLTSTSFYVEANFDKPVIFSKASNYYLSVAQTFSAVEDDAPPLSNNASATVYDKYLDTSTGRGQELTWVSVTGTNVDRIFDIFGAVFTDTATPSGAEINGDGLGHGYFTITQRAAGFPALNNIPYIVSVNGLKDDSSGTITGAASSVLTTAKHAIRCLDREWNGSTWTGGRFDWTKLSGYHGLGSRIIKGRTEGRTLLQDFISNICKSSASKVLQVNSTTPLAFYAWGTSTTPTVRLSQEDTQIISLERKGTETIINRLTLLYDKRVKDTQLVGVRTQDGQTDFAGVIDWRYTTSALTTALSTNSRSLYGDRVLDAPEHPWIGDSTTAEEMAKYYLGVFAYPLAYATVEVPYLKYSAIEIMDVIYIVHPDLPSYFGTSSNAALPTYGTTTLTEVDLIQGNYWVRAQEIRAQVEGKEIIIGDSDYPRLRLNLKLLLNYPADPT